MPKEKSKQKTISEGEIAFNPSEVVALLREVGFSVPAEEDEDRVRFYATCPHNGLQIDIKALGGLKIWWREEGEVVSTAAIVEEEAD